MRRLAAATLLLASVGLGGCVFAIGSTVDLPGQRIQRLEKRMSAAEKKLGIEKEAQK